ncbi:MAG: hypothetical protein LBJ69_00895 [Holosporales bacterium]|jgi:hypothetical protein|nr:hypothetical protein [Holosporales bacterium]
MKMRVVLTAVAMSTVCYGSGMDPDMSDVDDATSRYYATARRLHQFYTSFPNDEQACYRECEREALRLYSIDSSAEPTVIMQSLNSLVGMLNRGMEIVLPNSRVSPPPLPHEQNVYILRAGTIKEATKANSSK